MNVADQLAASQSFFDSCMDELRVKAPDYAPEDVIFLDIFEQASCLQVSPEEVLFHVFMKKHLTALRRHISHGGVLSETPRSRTRDLANYSAMLDVLLHHRAEIADAIAEYWIHHRCETPESGETCVSRFDAVDQVTDMCDRCRQLQYANRIRSS